VKFTHLHRQEMAMYNIHLYRFLFAHHTHGKGDRHHGQQNSCIGPCPFCGRSDLVTPNDPNWAEKCPGNHGQHLVVWYSPATELEDGGRWEALEHLSEEEMVGRDRAARVLGILMGHGDWIETEDGWVFYRQPLRPTISVLILDEAEVKWQ